jgi:hypothetical protein
MPLQFLRPVECFELEIEVDRLHFFDADRATGGVDREAVDPAGDRDIPILVHYAMDDMNLRAVVYIVGSAQLRAAAVDVLADPHPAEAVATFHADPTIGRGIDEITDRTDDFALVVVDAHD